MILTVAFTALAIGIGLGFIAGYYSTRPDYPTRTDPRRDGHGQRPRLHR